MRASPPTSRLRAEVMLRQSAARFPICSKAGSRFSTRRSRPKPSRAVMKRACTSERDDAHSNLRQVGLTTGPLPGGKSLNQRIAISALRFQNDQFRRIGGVERDAQKMSRVRNDSVRISAPDSLPAVDQNSQKAAASRNRHSRQTAKSSTQFLHRSKMVYFYLLYQ